MNQPIYYDEKGVERFESNAVVSYLLETKQIDLNEIMGIDFPIEDKSQFLQLIGYSVSAYQSQFPWATPVEKKTTFWKKLPKVLSFLMLLLGVYILGYIVSAIGII